MEHFIRTGSVRSSGSVFDRSKALSYPASRCVLQHLEANTRILLASHCHSLCNQHIRVPLKLQYLELHQYVIQINNVRHEFGFDHTKFCVRYNVSIQNSADRSVDLPHYKNRFEAMQHLMKKFVLQGHTPLANKFKTSWGSTFEPKFRVKVLFIESINGSPINLHSLIAPESFPLETLSIDFQSQNDYLFQNDYSKLCNFLKIIGRQQDIRSEKLVHLRNKFVEVSWGDNGNRDLRLLAQLAQNWMNASRDVGTKYTFQYKSDPRNNYLRRLSERITELTEVSAREDDYHQIFSFPMERDKELIIYEQYGPHEKTVYDRCWFERPWTLVMEIV